MLQIRSRRLHSVAVSAKRPYRKRAAQGLVLLLGAALLAAGVSGCGKQDAKNASADQSVVATYKGGQVTRDEFDKFIAVNALFNPMVQQMAADPGAQNYLLEQLIAFKILAGRADDKTKAESDKQIKQQMDQITQAAESQGGKGALEKQLKTSNLTVDDLQHVLQLNFYAVADMEGKVDDQQIKDEYDKRLKEDPNAFDFATVRHILIQTTDPQTGKEVRTKDEALKRAGEVLDKLKNGGDFAALAKEYSEDPGSKDNGGKYENAPVSQWVPEFKKAALEQPLNEIGNPIEVPYGYHILKVEARTTKTFDEVKESLRSQIAENDIYDFMDKELPGLIETNNLPKPQNQEPAPSEPQGGSPADQAKPDASAPAAPSGSK